MNDSSMVFVRNGAAVNAPAQSDDKLLKSRREAQLFRMIAEETPDYAFILFNPENHVVSWTSGAERIFGYTESEALGIKGDILFVPEDRKNGASQEEMRKAIQEGKSEDDRWHLRKDGSRFWASGILRAVYDEGGRLEGFIKILRDLTEKKYAEEALRRSEERFRLFIENVTEYALIQVDLSGRVTFWNPGAQRLIGYTEEEICGKPLSILCTQEDIDSKFMEGELRRALERGSTEEERWMMRKDGRRFWARWITTAIQNSQQQPCAFAKVMRDETERKRAEEQLRASLLEKDVLLQEVHHRVKNNLQVVVSLLGIQASRIRRRDVIDLLNQTQNRVRAIAGIHETLYSSPDLASINFSEYMNQLIRSLFIFYKVEGVISLTVETDDIVLDITQAIPLGLIVNELVTNALKHAFPGGRTGAVRITLRYMPESSASNKVLDDGSAALTVEDNGVGLPAGFDIQEQESMGVYLIKILTRQLHGAVQAETNNKTQFRVVFPLDPAFHSEL